MDYRIDELARASNTTIRNIRAYQERGLLPPPRREGRAGMYCEAHLARLRIITALLERGYSLANIAELLETWEAGGDLRELLGFEQAVLSPFIDEAEDTVTPDDIARMFGPPNPLSAGRLELAVKLRLLIPDEDKFRVPSMRLLRAGAELFDAGVPTEALFEELSVLREDLDRIAGRFVSIVQRHVFARYRDSLPAPRETAKITEMVLRMRPLADLVVVTELAHAMERHIRAALGDRLTRILDERSTATSQNESEK